MGNRTNYGTGRMTVDNRQKNERSRSGNPYSSHVKAGKHAGTVYNFKRKSRIRKSLTRLPILLEFIHKYIFLNFVSFYNGLNSNYFFICNQQYSFHCLSFFEITARFLYLSYCHKSGHDARTCRTTFTHAVYFSIVQSNSTDGIHRNIYGFTYLL